MNIRSTVRWLKCTLVYWLLTRTTGTWIGVPGPGNGASGSRGEANS